MPIAVQPHYRLLLYNASSEQLLSELPILTISYSEKLNTAGSLTAELKMNHITNKVTRSLTPGYRTLYLYRNGVLVWGGILYEKKYSSENRTLRIEGRTFVWYFMNRIVEKSYNFVNKEQIDIATDILFPFLNDMNMVIAKTNPSGIKRDIKIAGADLKYAWDCVSHVFNMKNGFDIHIQAEQYKTVNNGNPKPWLRYYYPYKGKSINKTDLVFDYPHGSIISYENTTTINGATNYVYGVAGGEDSKNKIYHNWWYTRSPTNWFIPIDIKKEYPSVKNRETLKAHIRAELFRKRAPIESLSVTVRTNRESAPTIGSFSIGDWALFRVNDEYYYYSAHYRIVEYEVVVDNKGLEVINFTLNSKEQASYYTEVGKDEDGN